MNCEIALRWIGPALNVALFTSGLCLFAAFFITDQSIREIFGKSYVYLFIAYIVGLVVAIPVVVALRLLKWLNTKQDGTRTR